MYIVYLIPKSVYLWVYTLQGSKVQIVWRTIGGVYRNFFLATERWMFFVPIILIWPKGATWGSFFLIGALWGYLDPWYIWPNMLGMDVILGIYATILWCKKWMKIFRLCTRAIFRLNAQNFLYNLIVPPFYVSRWIPLVKTVPMVYGFVYLWHIGEDLCNFLWYIP